MDVTLLILLPGQYISVLGYIDAENKADKLPEVC